MNKQIPKKGFLNKKELAEYLGLSVFTIDTWVSQQREIPFVRMGRRVLFDLEDIKAWVEKRKVYPRSFENKSDSRRKCY